MTQHPLERRFKRLAASANKKAAKLGRRGRITHETLFLVYTKSQGFCAYCQVGITAQGCSFDHVIPFDRGGDNDIDNIVACCMTCQREKFTKTPTEFEEYRQLQVPCQGCGKLFRPRWADYQRGFGRYHSRACSGRAGGQS